MKLKITEPGWINFSGNFGGIEFVDNVSVRDVTELEAFRLANLVRIENLEDGKNPSSSQQALDSICMSMAVGMDDPKNPVGNETSAQPTLYTLAQLEAIADEKGIKGIREISDPMDIKSTSIKSLIDGILNKQTPPVAVQAPAAVEASAVADAPAADAPAADAPAEAVPQGLMGSSIQPAAFEFATGVTTPLGDVVREAFKLSGMTVEEWNAAEPVHREQLIGDEVARRTAAQ
jgi:hypothetical protein